MKTRITPTEASRKVREICALAPIVPVLIVHDVRDARPLAQALVAGGLPALEVTLRTPAALEVIHEMSNVAGGIVGAGTLLTPEDARAARDAGARFGVSPGATGALLDAAENIGLPLLPGAATASEAMALLARGYDMLKFFPAGAAGGVGFLKSLASPLPDVAFCPTGGVNIDTAPAYLALPNVPCAGGSWVAPEALIKARDWAAITALAAKACELLG